jgi:hypothetical protein
MVLHGELLSRLAGPWSGIRPRLAVTLLNDAVLRAECGVNLRDMFSHVLIFFRCELDKHV